MIDWNRYNGLVSSNVVRRPASVIIAEKEAQALEAMTGKDVRAEAVVGVELAEEKDWTVQAPWPVGEAIANLTRKEPLYPDRFREFAKQFTERLVVHAAEMKPLTLKDIQEAKLRMEALNPPGLDLKEFGEVVGVDWGGQWLKAAHSVGEMFALPAPVDGAGFVKYEFRFPLPKVGMRVRDFGRRDRSRDGVVEIVDSKYVCMKCDDGLVFNFPTRKHWLRDIFPADPALLPPRVGMTVKLRQFENSATVVEGKITGYSPLERRWTLETSDGGIFGFDTERHWLRIAWPVGLGGDRT